MMLLGMSLTLQVFGYNYTDFLRDAFPQAEGMSGAHQRQ